MGIIRFPNDLVVEGTVVCVVCRRQILPAAASAGLCGSDGKLTFICKGHFWDVGRFIIGLADFTAAERLKREYGGIADAWALR